MAKESPHQTNYTRQMRFLLAKVYGRSPLKDSLLDLATEFFESGAEESIESDLSEDPKKTEENDKPAEESPEQQELRQERFDALKTIAYDVIELAEADSFQENNRKSAQFLGTLQLLSPVESSRIASIHEESKSVYKAVLCLRLLDRVIMDNKLNDPYINQYIKELSAEQYRDLSRHDMEAYKLFTEQVKVPLVIAALLQDIGNYHPAAQSILCGSDGDLNPFRVLEKSERKELLKISYSETLSFLNKGIGVPFFVGNTRAEREQFLEKEEGKLAFINELLKATISGKSLVSNLLKVPQIYTSIILSSKESYNYKLLPQVFQVLNKNAELGACKKEFVDALYQITGMFPQGFGIVYLPTGGYIEPGDCYEYGIVNMLYPENPEEPICRVATRKLTFMGYGHNFTIDKQRNLYFTQTAKKLATLSKERLNEILELLSHNFKERRELDLLPRCWYANEFFSVKAHQSLWNKIELQEL